MYMTILKRYFAGLSRDTILLSLSSLFSDISTEMLYPILPVFLTNIIKAPANIIGLIEGLATGIQYTIQGVSGYFSDKLQRRKPIALFGFTLAALAKPAIGLATGWPFVLAGRFLDRLGAGTRSAPRDALVASSASEQNRGKAFGLEGFGDNLGAFLGPVIAAGLLFSLKIPIRTIFYLTVIPGIIAIFMILFVKEKKTLMKAKSKLEIKNLNKFSPPYWKYIFVTGIFGIGNSSNAFLILRAQQIGIPLFLTIFVYAFFNLVAALSSYPAGFLSDRLGRKNVLLVAFIIFTLVYAGFAFSSSFVSLCFLFLLYGVHTGIFRAVGKALATDLVPEEIRASGVGWYSTTIGLSGFIASIVGGQLWVNIGSQATFIYGVIFSVIATGMLFFLVQSTHILHKTT